VSSDSVLATRRDDGALALAAWNYAPPGQGGVPREITLRLAGLGTRRQVVIIQVDDQHGSAVTAWESMGKPSFPSREQQELLRAAGQLPAPEIRLLPDQDPATVNLTLPPHALAFVEIR
jgi:xylan 1,4-beta-xylosidase